MWRADAGAELGWLDLGEVMIELRGERGWVMLRADAGEETGGPRLLLLLGYGMSEGYIVYALVLILLVFHD